jgi:hypothetical protein
VHGRASCSLNPLNQAAGIGTEKRAWVGVVTAHEKNGDEKSKAVRRDVRGYEGMRSAVKGRRKELRKTEKN